MLVCVNACLSVCMCVCVFVAHLRVAMHVRLQSYNQILLLIPIASSFILAPPGRLCDRATLVQVATSTMQPCHHATSLRAPACIQQVFPPQAVVPRHCSCPCTFWNIGGNRRLGGMSSQKYCVPLFHVQLLDVLQTPLELRLPDWSSWESLPCARTVPPTSVYESNE